MILEVCPRPASRWSCSRRATTPVSAPAQPGEYVTIVYCGPMQLKAAVPVAAGEKLTVDDNGDVRGLRKTEVNGIPVAEDAPVLGIALRKGQDFSSSCQFYWL